MARFKPRRAGRWIALGDAANRRRDWAAAEIAYKQALDANAGLTHIWVQYGHSLKEQGRLENAEKAYRRATVLAPDDPDGHLHLGHVLMGGARKGAALRHYCAALALDPNNPETVRAVGQDAEAFGAHYAQTWAILRDHRVSPAFLDFFDWEYYLFSNGLVQMTDVPNENEALGHFLTNGVERMLFSHPRWGFDPNYYRARHHKRSSLSQAALYRKWLEEGIGDGLSPNIVHEIETLIGVPGLTMRLVEGILGRNHASIIACLDRSIADFVRAIEVGEPPFVRNVAILDATSLPFFNAVADRLYLQGKKELARAYREAILLFVPRHPVAMQHLADSFIDSGEIARAAPLYQTLIANGDPTEWTYINLSRCRAELNDARGEFDAIAAAVRRFPIDRGLRRMLEQKADRFFWATWNTAGSASTAEQVSAGQAAIAAACELIAPTPGARAKAPRPGVSPRPIALVANEGLAQCRLYRVEQKMEQLQAAGYVVEKFNSDRELDAFLASADRFDVVIFYRVPAWPAMMRAIQAATLAGAVTVYEIDDLIFDSDHYPPVLADYGGLVAPDEYRGLALGVPLFDHAMRLCDYAMASTPALGEQMASRVRSGQAILHRNALGVRHLKAIDDCREATPAKPVTILYGSGTKAHKQDFTDLLEPALVEICRRHGDGVRIVLVGYRSISESLAAVGERLVLIDPIVDVGAYWALLSEADINLAVLAPSLIADCKSEIKWLEAAMLGIPSAVSRTRTYEEVVRHGETGFLCTTTEEWTDAIDRLVRDPVVRRKVGDAARSVALNLYGPAVMRDGLARIIERIAPPVSRAIKRIAIVNVFYPPQAIGGATRVVHDNVRALVDAHGERLEVEVFTSIDGEPDGYRVLRQIVDGVSVTGVTTPSDHRIEQRTHDLRMGEIFGRFLDRGSFDLVHFHCIQRLTASIVEAARNRNIPYLITAHDGWWISDDQFLVDESDRITLYNYALSQIERSEISAPASVRRMGELQSSLEGAKHILPVSDEFAEIYSRAGVSRIRAVPNGVSDLPERQRRPAPDHRVRLAHIGGASRHKGFHLIRQALWLGAYDNLHLTVVDHAMPRGTSLDAMWGTTPVRFVPRVEQDQVADLYHATDVLLAPSIWPESFGLVTREALASGCWVIASDRGAIGSDIEEDINGYRVDVSSAAGLASVFARIDTKPERYRAMPAHVPRFRIAADQANDLALLYTELLDTREPHFPASLGDSP